MRNVMIAFGLMIVAFGGGHAQAESVEGVHRLEDPATLSDLAWMAGCWADMDESGTRVEECWMAPAGGLMLGVHRETREGKPAWFEYLRIQKGAGEIEQEGIVYRASPGGQPATAFHLVSIKDQRVVFENEFNDFPSRIIYWRLGDTLHARAEGEAEGAARALEWAWKRVPFPDGDR